MDPKFKSIVKLFQKLPGVGPRQAARFVLSLIEKPQAELEELGSAISNLKDEVKQCRHCFNLSDDEFCAVCSDSKRDQSKIMVVEKVTDLDAVERSGLYKGLYHVLGGAISPLDNITPVNLHIKELRSRTDELLKSGKLEMIIATNLTAAGETTALYLTNIFRDKPGINITRLARGLASGSHLEYADEGTLKNALEYRK